MKYVNRPLSELWINIWNSDTHNGNTDRSKHTTFLDVGLTVVNFSPTEHNTKYLRRKWGQGS